VVAEFGKRLSVGKLTKQKFDMERSFKNLNDVELKSEVLLQLYKT
jgi:hypothetical protein